MKLSISLTDSIAKTLSSTAKDSDTSVSSVIESALRRFEALPASEQKKAIRETHGYKRALTRTGWMSVFWEILADEFGRTDFAHGDPDRVAVLRTYDGFCVVFLDNWSSVDDAERGELIVHIFESPGGQHGPVDTTRYQQTDSVFNAARSTADWIRKHQ